jgi:hypothetical protein
MQVTHFLVIEIWLQAFMVLEDDMASRDSKASSFVVVYVFICCAGVFIFLFIRFFC